MCKVRTCNTVFSVGVSSLLGDDFVFCGHVRLEYISVTIGIVFYMGADSFNP